MAVVVKVKYEDTLRRFNAYTKEDGNIDLNLDGLRSKIYELFQFNPNTQFVITYVDEDNDIVTMADNDDLYDAFRQGLNPLRLQVSLINQTNRGMERHTQSLPTTPRSSSVPNDRVQTFDLRSVCSDETLKALPEPVRNALMNFIKDCPVLTSTSSISDFVQGMIKLASTNLPPFMKSQEVAGASNGAKAINTVFHINDSGEQGIGNVKSGSNDRAGPSVLPGGSIHGHVLKKKVHVGENMHRVFHKGVQCDGCGMNPIVGPRYKSTLKDDYDLCHSCFCESSNQDEYTKIDRALYRPPRFARGRAFAEMGLSGKEECPFLKQRLGNPYYPFQSASAPSTWKQHNKAYGKLDCRFVEDVTIFDGTQLAPGTEFTKIWRLRNNGTVPWPQHTQLVRVGGDDLGAGNAINLEIQEQGYPVNEEIDAAVDFVAPMQPGRYVSYWRLMAPSGQKFGQRVWVLIQVEIQKDDLPNLMESLLNLNDVDQNSPFQQKNMEKEIGGAGFSEGPQQEQRIDDNQMSLDSQDYLLIEGGQNPYDKTVKELPLFFPGVGIDVSTQVQGIGAPTEVQGSSSMTTESMHSSLGTNVPSYTKSVPVDYASAGTTVVPASAPSLTGSEVQFTLGRNAEDVTGIEHKLLDELEVMGFKHKGLNAEVLKKNNYDIQKTLDDLCGTSDWDPILDELQEMGFHDSEMNKRLLMKNEGSVKRVVIDLLSAERDALATQSPSSKKAKQS